MQQAAKRIAAFFAAFILLVFALFVINQTVQVVRLASDINRSFGSAVLWALVFIYAGLLLMPAVLWLKLPKNLLPPPQDDCVAYEAFLRRLKKRLVRNPQLNNVPLNTQDDIRAALGLLDQHADEVVAAAASTVFLSTAISQSGRLDGLVVLVTQVRLIWQVAHIYLQRPSLREFVQLYVNVASTALIATEVDDIDVEGLVGTIFGSTVAAIPGTQILMNSALSGAANAFLTLRVGMIAKGYCDCTVRPEKKKLRRAATVQAAKLLGSIVKNGTTKLMKATLKATVKTPASKIRGILSRSREDQKEEINSAKT
jgi:hypothetical protein